ncbi:MAG TPA: transcription termination/antitermination protein NusG [Mesorhizobium sp.]|jgi:transcription antitermination factor NusG|uniref:transcription termination/antitermination protein NusG n=1 Tax=Mesorhizobium sp. TaxID=1871066 RepID=UPI002DDCBCAA|nr:transcription termination/antitermination protein NusG [Mesorhizobium sp.]HEV2502346.1 transcription termination/antitermination protein NusG [Mesorhizobium sp.]
MDVKRLHEAERTWIAPDTGEIINIDRAWQASDRRIAISQRQRALLAAAGQDGPEARWYVLSVGQGADNCVNNLLADAKIEHWMAQQTIVVRRRGRYGMERPKDKTVPFLPGYIFVKVVWCMPCWEALSGLKGVLGIVGGVERPPYVDDAKVLKMRADIENDPEAVKAMLRAINPGDRVSVDDGPFSSFPGVVDTVNENTGRAKVEVLIFGRVVSVDLAIAHISKTF